MGGTLERDDSRVGPVLIEQPPLIEVSNLTKNYGAVQALKGVSLSVYPGEIHALCGENGAGKSTLVRILAGVTQPDGGDVLMDGRRVSIRTPLEAQLHGIALVDQELSLAPNLSIEENIFLGSSGVPLFHRRRELRTKAEELMYRLGLGHLPPSTPVGALRMGERQLVEVARLLARDARLLILDEPTATLFDVEIERVFDAVRELAAMGRAILFVTHRLGEVFSLCHRVTVLRNGEWVAARPVQDLDRGSLIELMLGKPAQAMYLDAPAPKAAWAAPLLEIRGLHLPGRFQPLDLAVRPGQVVGLAGQLGCGAGEVLQALAGLNPDARGNVSVRGRPLRLGSLVRAMASGLIYVSNDRAAEGLFQQLSVEHNLTGPRLASVARLGWLVRRLEQWIARSLAKRIGVGADRLRARVAQLSGGYQQKVALARCLERQDGAVLLLNEPTRGVDVGARAEIHRLIRRSCAAGCAVMMTSTDLEEILGMSDVILTMFRGKCVSIRAREAVNAHSVLAEITHPAQS